MEKWKPIRGYEGLYEISDHGKIKALPKKWSITNNRIASHKSKILTPQKNSTGYYRINLVKDKIPKMFFVSRLVAEHFIPNPKNKPEINHKDEIKSNNFYKNLEWCTRIENMHANGFMERHKNVLSEKNSKIVYQYTKELMFIKQWKSGLEAEKHGFTSTLISACCNGRQHTHKGYVWSLKKLH